MRAMIWAAAVFFTAQTANATTITVNGNFSATGWLPVFGSEPPLDPLFLSYSVTFDTTQTYEDSSTELTIFNTNIPYPIRFSSGANANVFTLATFGDSQGCTTVANSFCAFVLEFDSGVARTAAQGTPDGSAWQTFNITDNNLQPAVPEPASWAMLITGFGLAGAILRRRRAAITA
jgi:hypothetical protein